MGAAQSTRDIPNYVFVQYYVDKEEYINVNLLVYDTTQAYKVHQSIRERDDIEISEKISKCELREPINSRNNNNILYMGIHTDVDTEICTNIVETTKISVCVTKTLEELIEERKQLQTI